MSTRLYEPTQAANEDITELNLSNTNMTNVDLQNYVFPPFLRKLNLIGNKITSLPGGQTPEEGLPGIEFPQSLEVLNISKITSLPGGQPPEEGLPEG